MKTIITFIAGAVLASGLVYLMMNPKGQPPETAAVQTPVTAAPSAAEPAPIATPEATEANGSTPSTAAPASSVHKPSPMPAKASAHTPAKPAHPAPSSTTPSSTGTSGSTTTTGQQQQASNNTPAAPPYYDPNRNLPGPPPEDRKPEPPNEFRKA